MMTPISKLDLVQKWYQRVWIGGDLGAISDYFTADVQAAGVMPGLDLRPADFAELIPALMRLVVHPSFTVLRHLETDDWLWALIRFQAQTAAELAPVDVTSQLCVRFSDGRIAEAYNHVDMLSFFEQLGALPADTMALCLMGERLG